jgi:hypothetical protein
MIGEDLHMQREMTWTSDELERIGTAEDLQLASVRDDGTLRRYVTMWVARVGDAIYVRSAGGPKRPWYRHAQASGAGRIRAGGLDRAVTFEDANADARDAIDAAYHAKYDRYGPNIVGHVIGKAAQAVTVRLEPAAEDKTP